MSEQAQNICLQQNSTTPCEGDLDGVESEDENFGLQDHRTGLIMIPTETDFTPKITKEDEIKQMQQIIKTSMDNSSLEKTRGLQNNKNKIRALKPI